VPTIATATATGDISNPGANVANYNFGADWNGPNGNVTTVGSAGIGSESFHGTSDQGGNVFEWTERIASSQRASRGGTWNFDETWLQSQTWTPTSPGSETLMWGFRVASPAPPSTIPTVSEWGLAAMLLLLLTAETVVLMRRRAPSA